MKLKNVPILISFFSLCIQCLSQTPMNIQVNNKMLTIIDQNGDTIISPNTQQLWEPFSVIEHPIPSLAPQITCKVVPTGCDIIYTFNNSSPFTYSLGKIQVGGIRFDRLIFTRVLHNTGEEKRNSYPKSMESSNDSMYAYGSYYPKSLFSPVMTVNDTALGYTLCLSLLYPVLEYKHNIHPVLYSSNINGRSWTPVFKLNNYYLDSIKNNKCFFLNKVDSTVYSSRGDLKPGEVRTYTLCLRLVKNNDSCANWLSGLQPYKDYFRSKYGGVQYERDARPIARWNIANRGATADNPYGFNLDNYLRPDSFGFGPLAHEIIEKKYKAVNYERFIMWLPSGSQWQNKSRNMPYKFTSHWFEGDKKIFPHSYGHKMGDAIDSLKLIPAPNREFGLWWGRSGQPMFDWDTNYFRVMDPYDPLLVQLGFNELDNAIKVGVKIIGLDAFKDDLPVWDGYVWLKMMKKRAPDVKFITERWGCDILQTMAGMLATDKPPGLPVAGPHYLSDFLLPGVEKIAAIQAGAPTVTERFAKLALLNSWGYTVCSKPDTLPTKGSFLAAESWYSNNPFPDLGVNMPICNGETITLNANHAHASSFIWSTGATTNSIQVTSPGTYFVQTTTTAGCIANDTVVLFSCTTTGGINQNPNQMKMFIYPNPSNGIATIKLDDYQLNEEYNINMYNVLGEAVRENIKMNSSEFTFSTIDFAKGVYFLGVRNSKGGVALEKLIVE